MIRSLVGLAAANVLLVALGAGVLLALGTWSRTAPGARLGLSLFAGLAAFTALVPMFLYAGLSPSPLIVALLSLVVCGGGWIVHRRRQGLPRDPGGGGAVFAVLAAFPLVLLAARAVVKPLWVGDAILNWTLKAKILHGHGGALTGGLEERFFTSDAYGFAHLEYPLGLPSLEAFAFYAMGTADTRVVHVQFVLVLGAFTAALWVLLRPHLDPFLLCAALFALLMTPAIHLRLLTGYADIPLAAYWVGAAVALALWLRGDGRDRLLLAALFAAAALATKQEGMLFCAVLFVGAAVFLIAVDRDRTRLRVLALAAAASFSTAVPWKIYSLGHGLENPAFKPELGIVKSRLGDLPEIGANLAKATLHPDWHYVVPLALAACAVLLVRGPRLLAAAYLLTSLGVLAALTLVYLATVPHRDITHLLGQSADRVMSAPIILASAALPVLLAQALARREERETHPIADA